MDNDVYINPTKIIFGKGAEEEIGREAAKYAQHVLLHYGKGSAEQSGLLNKIRDSLKSAGVAFTELGGVKPNPTLSTVLKGIQACKCGGIGAVVAVGGGSVIDSAKAIACGAPNAENVWDYFLNKAKPEAVLPVLTVLTLPGAGSESSNRLVITNEETGEKLVYGDDRVRPAVSLLNPELTSTASAFYSATGVADAMAHIMERYFTNTRHVDTSDRLCEAILKTLILFGKEVLKNPENYDVRAEIMWACKLAHDGVLGVGREEDWGVHNIEHEITAIYDVPHAAGLTALYPAWMRFAMPHDINRFAQFAVRVFGADYNFDDPKLTAIEGIERLKEYFSSLGLPVSLKQIIPDKSRLGEMAAAAAKHAERHGVTHVGKFVKLNKDDILQILEDAWEN